MRWLSSAICTSGEPVSPSTVAYSAMIFFLVSASVPIDTSNYPSLTRCAARRGLFTRALWFRGRCTADVTRTGNCARLSAPPRFPESAPVPPGSDSGSDTSQTAGGGSLSTRRWVWVWVPSACVVVRTAVVRRRALSWTAVRTSTITPPSTRIQPSVWMSTPDTEAFTARASTRPTTSNKIPSPYPMSCLPAPATPSAAIRGQANPLNPSIGCSSGHSSRARRPGERPSAVTSRAGAMLRTCLRPGCPRRLGGRGLALRLHLRGRQQHARLHTGQRHRRQRGERWRLQAWLTDGLSGVLASLPLGQRKDAVELGAPVAPRRQPDLAAGVLVVLRSLQRQPAAVGVDQLDSREWMALGVIGVDVA